MAGRSALRKPIVVRTNLSGLCSCEAPAAESSVEAWFRDANQGRARVSLASSVRGTLVRNDRARRLDNLRNCRAFSDQNVMPVRGDWLVELRGIEPLTSAVRLQRSPI
jgi:hypothetical protein